MTTSQLLDAQVQEKRRYTLLNELFDLTGQLAEAVDRGDEVAMRMLLSMREEPLERLRQVERSLAGQKTALSAQEADRLGALLSGAAAEQPEETALSEQVGANRRLLAQLVELDRRVNQKVTREKSVYQ